MRFSGRCLRGSLCLLATLCLLPPLAVPAGAAELPDPKPLPAVKGIIDQFDRYRLVAIGEDHGLVPIHKLFRDLVRDPRFAAKVNDVVVEFGNARYQSLMDRFILKGEPVPIQRLRAVWRDSIGGGHLGTWDAPVYEQFFRTVRRVNQGLPSGRRLRVLLGDSPINWATATPQQVTYWAERRDRTYASVVEREVLAKGHRALLIAGALHFQRDPNAPVNAPAPNALTLIERRHPGSAFSVTLPPFFELEPFIKDWPFPSIAVLKGTNIGALRQPRPPGAPPAPKLEEQADALLKLDPAEATHYSTFYPSAFDDRAWAEIQRRFRLDGVPFDEVERDIFQVECQYASTQGRGIPQASRERGPHKEPREAGRRQGGDPQPAKAVPAILAALADHRVVALGDAPGLQQEHRLLAALLKDRTLPGRVNDLVVGFGNARHQAVVDRYVAGQPVSATELARVWRDTSQLFTWDNPVYEEFFRAVRTLNEGLPAARRVRVLLGEPPLDWAAARGPQEVRRTADDRRFLTALLEREVLAKGRRALLIALRSRVTRQPGSPLHVLERRHRGATFVIVPHVGFGARNGALEARFQGWTAPALATVRGNWLGALRAGANLGGTAAADRSLEDLADAYLFLGKRATLGISSPPPATYRDAYVRELQLRHRLLFGRPFDPGQAFPTSDCHVTVPEDSG